MSAAIQERVMSNKVFVGGLSWNTDDQGLHQAFAQFGDVSEARVVTDRETGRSRGFGFVTFADGEGVSKAIQGMDGKDLDGRTIKVNEAEDKPRAPRRDAGPRHGGGNNRW